jgi:type 1 glutamine amidotransferase
VAKKALIVFGGWPGHAPKETAALMAGDLTGAGFEVELSETLDSFLDASKLKTFDLIVPHWTMGQITGDQEKGLMDAIASGAGLGGVHGGMGDAFRANTGFQFMTGGQFVAHPDDHKDYVVNFVKTADPIVAGLKDFTIHSEQYYMHVDPSNEVLATTTFQSASAPWVNGTVMPLAWKRKFGAGRVFYHSIGHAEDVLKIEQVRELTLRGLKWAAR